METRPPTSTVYSNSPTSKEFLAICLDIMNRALQKVDPQSLIHEHVSVNDHGDVMKIMNESFDLRDYRKIHVLGAGKGAPFLFHGLVEVLGDWIEGGVIVSLEDHRFSDERVEFVAGSHPVPDERSAHAGDRMLDYVWKHVGRNDLVLFLVTGGASSLMEVPAAPLTIMDLAAANELLLRSGLDIHEINCFRRRLSAAKGGKLAIMIHPARIVTLALSDVPDSPISDIGSGPSVPVEESPEKAQCLIKRYDLDSVFEPRILECFQREDEAMRGWKNEEGSKGTNEFSQDRTFVLGDIKIALEKAREVANEKGFQATISSFNDSGDVRMVAKDVATWIREMREDTLHSFRRGGVERPGEGNDRGGQLFLSGGELTVKVVGHGKGGRNQEFVLALMSELKDHPMRYFTASVATDGVDGSTDGAGAWADETTYRKALGMALDPEVYLENNDSYSFFKELNQLIVTGPTRTNVMDIRMVYLP